MAELETDLSVNASRLSILIRRMLGQIQNLTKLPFCLRL